MEILDILSLGNLARSRPKVPKVRYLLELLEVSFADVLQGRRHLKVDHQGV